MITVSKAALELGSRDDGCAVYPGQVEMVRASTGRAPPLTDLRRIELRPVFHPGIPDFSEWGGFPEDERSNSIKLHLVDGREVGGPVALPTFNGLTHVNLTVEWWP